MHHIGRDVSAIMERVNRRRRWLGDSYADHVLAQVRRYGLREASAEYAGHGVGGENQVAVSHGQTFRPA
jgi:hypothetical protein